MTATKSKAGGGTVAPEACGHGPAAPHIPPPETDSSTPGPLPSLRAPPAPLHLRPPPVEAAAVALAHASSERRRPARSAGSPPRGARAGRPPRPRRCRRRPRRPRRGLHRHGRRPSSAARSLATRSRTQAAWNPYSFLKDSPRIIQATPTAAVLAVSWRTPSAPHAPAPRPRAPPIPRPEPRCACGGSLCRTTTCKATSTRWPLRGAGHRGRARLADTRPAPYRWRTDEGVPRGNRELEAIAVP
jgi:hypothetical protein